MISIVDDDTRCVNTCQAVRSFDNVMVSSADAFLGRPRPTRTAYLGHPHAR